MSEQQEIVDFYRKQLPGAQGLPEDAEVPTWLRSQCPFCQSETPGILNVDLDPESLFFGLFGCSALCSPPGYAFEFARQLACALEQSAWKNPAGDTIALRTR